MELSEDGCMNNDITDVLNKWKREFSSLLNSNDDGVLYDNSGDNNLGIRILVFWKSNTVYFKKERLYKSLRQISEMSTRKK